MSSVYKCSLFVSTRKFYLFLQRKQEDKCRSFVPVSFPSCSFHSDFFLICYAYMSRKVFHNTEGRKKKKPTSTFMPIATCIECDTLRYKCVMSTQDDMSSYQNCSTAYV